MTGKPLLAEARRSFHAALLDTLLRTDDKGVPSNADKHSKPSIAIASGILERLGAESEGARLAGQMAGSLDHARVIRFGKDHSRPILLDFQDLPVQSRIDVVHGYSFPSLQKYENERGNVIPAGRA